MKSLTTVLHQAIQLLQSVRFTVCLKLTHFCGGENKKTDIWLLTKASLLGLCVHLLVLYMCICSLVSFETLNQFTINTLSAPWFRHSIATPSKSQLKVSRKSSNFWSMHMSWSSVDRLICVLIECQSSVRAENNGWWTDNVWSICHLDRSNFELAGHFDWSNLIIHVLKKTKVTMFFSWLPILHSLLQISLHFLIVEMQAETNWSCFFFPNPPKKCSLSPRSLSIGEHQQNKTWHF